MYLNLFKMEKQNLFISFGDSSVKIALNRKGLMKIGKWSLSILSIFFLGYFFVNYVFPVIAQALTSVTLVAPASNSYIKGTYTLNANVNSDAENVMNVTFWYINSTNTYSACNATNSTPNQINFNCSWNTASTPDGVYNFTANATNSTGDKTSIVNTNITIDNTAPTIELTYPPNNAYLKGSSVNLTGTASDTNNATVVTNDTHFATMGGTYASWNFTNTSALTDGIYHVQITANDSAGNSNSVIANFTVDNTNPVLINPIPTNNSYVYGRTNQLFQITAIEANLNTSSNATLYYKRSGVPAWNSETLNCWGTAPNYVCNDTVNLYGAYAEGDVIQFYFSLTDLAGNTGTNGTAANPLRTTIDRTAPTPSSDGQNASVIGRYDSVLLYANWNDNYALDYAVLATNETGEWENKTVNYSSPYNINLTTGQTWSNFTWSNSSMPVGSVIAWKIYGNDTAGNEAVTSEHTFSIDDTPPKWDLNSTNVTNGTTIAKGTVIEVRANWTDNVALGYYWLSNKTSGDWTNDTAVAFGTETWSNTTIDTSIFDAGATLQVKIYANDTSGNENVTDVWQWAIDGTAPTWSANNTSPPSGVIYSADANYQFNVTWNDDIAIDKVLIEENFTSTGAPQNYTVTTNDSSVYYHIVTDLPAGTYAWRMYANDTSGNENKTDQWTYTVAQVTSDVKLWLNDSKENKTYEKGQIANITASINVTGKTVKINANFTGSDKEIASGTNSATNITDTTNLGVGIYNITAYFAGDTNTTADPVTYYLTVEDATPPVLTNPVPANGTYIYGSATTQFNISIYDLTLNTSNVTVHYRRSGVPTWTDRYLVCSESAPNFVCTNTSDLYSGYADNDVIQYYFEATDNSTNYGSNGTAANPLTVRIDRTVPSVSSVTLNDTVIKAGESIQIDAVATDLNPIAPVNVTINNVQYQMTNTGGNNYQYNYTAIELTSGNSYTVNVTAYDAANNIGFNDTQSFTYDSTVPAVSIVSPTTNQNVTGNLLINASATDNVEVSVVQYNISNSTWSSTATMTNVTPDYYNATFNTATAADGLYNVTILSNDTAGNRNDTEYVTIRIDNTNPSVVFVSPTSSQNITGTITVNASVSDGEGSGAQAVGFNISNSSWGLDSWQALTQSGNYWSGTYNGATLKDGKYNITINATDYAGHENITEYVEITADNTAPTLLLYNLTGDGWFDNATAKKREDSLNFNISVSDGTGSGATGACNVSFQNTSRFYASPLISLVSGWCNGTVTIPTSLVVDGNYTINVTIADYVGLTGYNDSYVVWIDNTGPAVTNLAINDTDSKVKSTDALNITVDVSDVPAGVDKVLLNGTVMQEIDSSGTWYTINTTEQFNCGSTGTCVLLVTANDTLGNVNNTEYITLTVDNTYPQITIISPVTNQNISGSFLINASVTDNIEPSYVQYRLVNVSWAGDWFQMTNDTLKDYYNATNDTTSVADGIYNVTVWANDTVNNINQTNVTIRIDNTAPTVLLPDYVNGTQKIVGQSLTLNISVADSGSGATGSCNVSIGTGDNRKYATPLISLSSGWCNGTITIPTDASTGNQTLNATIIDYAGNLGFNDSYVVNVAEDSTSPTVLVYNASGLPLENATYMKSGQTLVLNVSVIEQESGITTNTCTVAVGSNYSTGNLTYVNGWCNGTITIPYLTDGNKTLNISIADAALNTGFNDSYVIQIDNTGPEIIIYEEGVLLENATFRKSGDPINLNISVSDGAGSGPTGSCGVYINETSAVSIPYSLGWCNGTATVPDFSGYPNGNYTLKVNVSDTLGNVGTNSSLVLTIDDTKPVITITTPANNTYNNSIAGYGWVNGTVYDLLGMSTANISVTGINASSYEVYNFTGGNNTEFSVKNKTVLADGQITLTIGYVDKAGNIENVTMNFYKDTTAPTATGLTNGTKAGNSIQAIQVTVTDMMTNATITLNYKRGSFDTSWQSTAVSGTPSTSTTYTATIDTSMLGSGETVYYYVTGTDNATNSISAVGNNANYSLNKFDIGEKGAIDGYIFLTDTTTGIEGVTVSTGTTGTDLGYSGPTGYYHISGVPAGTYTLTASKTGYYTNSTTATVTVGQTTQANITMAATDTTPPTITVNTYSYGPYGSDPGAVIDVDFNDNSNLDYVQYKINANGTWTNITTGISGTSYTNNWSVSWNSLSEGTNYIYVKAYDDAGNVYQSPEFVTIVKDTTYPGMTIFNPTAYSTSGPSVTLIVKTTESDTTCKYNLETDATYDSMTTFDSTGVGYPTSMAYLNGLSGGEHIVYVKCSDVVGNINNNTAPVRWVVDTSSPTVSAYVTPPQGSSNPTLVAVITTSVLGQTINGSQYRIRNTTGQTVLDWTDITVPSGRTNQVNVSTTISISGMRDGQYFVDIRGNTTNIGYNAIGGPADFWIDTRSLYNITRPCPAGGQYGEPSTYPCYFAVGWNAFALPLWALQNTTLTYYNVTSVLASVAGNYDSFYADIGNNNTWRSYVPGALANSFINFTYNGAAAVYFIHMNATDRIEIN